MFKAIKEFFVGKPAPVVAEVPYKVEVTPPTPVEVINAAEGSASQTAPAKKAPRAKAPAKPKAPAAKKTTTRKPKAE
jgi:hypothetical protein